MPSSTIGSSKHILVYHYSPKEVSNNKDKIKKRAYIQGALHADEHPSLLVTNFLIKLLDEADEKGEILEDVIIVPFANPIGLSQLLFGQHLGRFSFDTAINFNRDFLDLGKLITPKLANKLKKDDSNYNVNIIRELILKVINDDTSIDEESVLKKELLKLAAVSDVVIDLHCDAISMMHMYTHDDLWPAMNDLAAELDCQCQLLAPASGGMPFDEACSVPWATIKSNYASFNIPMACESVTVELRGELDVSKEYAMKDSKAIFNFLQRRGYILGNKTLEPLKPLQRDATPLTAVELIEASKPGIICWNVKLGQEVKVGDVLGEIVSIDEPSAPSTLIKSRTDGFVFAMRNTHIAKTGHTIIKIAGNKPLPWRTGNLLTL